MDTMFHHILVIYLVWMGLLSVESVGQTEICDDVIILSASSPNVTFSNPSFDDPSSTLNVRVNCHTSFVAIPDGMQVELLFLEVQTTNDEEITIYDDQSSTSSTFRIARFRGTLEGTPTVFSSKGGLTLVYTDNRDGVNGPGYLAQARLLDADLLSTTQPGLCGGTITLTDSRPTFSFSSLAYDNPTTTSYIAECTMYITSPTSKQVKASLLDTQMSNEYVRIYDHPSSTDRDFLVTTIFGTVEAGSTVFSSQEGLTLVYLADRLSSHGLGVRAELNILDGIPLESEGLCGGVIALTDSSPNHTFTTPLYNNPSMASVEMDFTLHILVPEGKQVQLTFLDIETTTSEAILVYQYTTTSSERVSYASGTVNTKSTVYSSRTGLSLIHQDNSDNYNGRGFKAEARVLDEMPRTLDGLFGGTIELTDSRSNITFYSPFYVQSSPDGVDIDGLIYILSPPGRQVQLTFLDIYTTASEKISVYDHPSSQSATFRVSYIYGPLLQIGAVIFSTRGGLTVVYDDTSRSSNGPGFRAVAQVIESFPPSQSGFCGGTIALNGSTPMIRFSSPLYDKPSIADALVDCTMHITSPEEREVRLTFLHIQTTSSESISLYDHPTLLNNQVAYFSGTLMVASVVYSSEGGLTITYDDTSDTFNGPGFLAEARILEGLLMNETGLCGGTISLTDASPRIIFSTPLYNDLSTSDINMDCTMYFVGPIGSHIQLIFNDFATTGSEKVVVYDHPSSQSNTYQVSQLSGPLNTRMVFFSSEEGLSLNYIDESNSFNGPGFTAEGRLLDGTDTTINPYQPGFCGGTIALTASVPNITFSSPHYDNQFSMVLSKCKIHITSPSGKQVRVVFSDIESNEQITVYDHPASESKVIMSALGTLSSTATVYSSTGGITLVYDDSDDSTNGRGYYAEAQIIDSLSSFEASFCGGAMTLTESFPQITFTTPLYEMPLVRDVDVDCTIFISVESGKQVSLTVRNFESPLDSNLQIFDHPSSSSSSRRVSTLSGSLNTSVVFLSSESGLTLKLQDHVSSNNERGFLGEGSISDPLISNLHGFCGGTAILTHSKSSILFSSPLYNNPSTNGLRVDCKFHFISPPDTHVHLIFLDIQTTTSERISVYDHPTSASDLIAFLSGTVRTPVNLYSSDAGLTIDLEDQSEAFNGPGFSAEARILYNLPSYQAGFCGGTMTLTYSTPLITFSTPLYDNPLMVDVTTNCRIFIRAPTNQEVKLTLKDIETTSSESVTIYDHPTSSNSPHRVFYFYGILNNSVTIISTNDGLNIDLSDASSLYNGKGFIAEAAIYNLGEMSTTESEFCGGKVELTQSSPLVTLSLPFFNNPSAAYVYMDCIMHIQGSSGEDISLTFLDMNTSLNEEVRIYNHPSLEINKVGSFRGNLGEGDATFFSSQGGFTLIYDDDSDSANGPGFLLQAQIKGQDHISSSLDGFCGGVVPLSESLPTVTVTTPLYGLSSPSDLRQQCTLYVTSPSGYQVQLTFIDFETTVDEGVTVYDGLKMIASFSGKLDATTTVFSSEGELTLIYQDSIAPFDRQGYHAEARILDAQPMNLDRTCGGYIFLSESLPRVIVTTPLYATPPTSNITMDCRWYFRNPSQDKQVELVLKNVDITENQIIHVYNHPDLIINRVASLTGRNNDSLFISVRYGLWIYLQDLSQDANGRGFLIDARLQGTVTGIPPTTGVNGTDVLTGQTGFTQQATTPFQEQDSQNNTTAIAASAVSVILFVIIALVVGVVVIIRSRRKRQERAQGKNSDLPLQPTRYPPEGNVSEFPDTSPTDGKVTYEVNIHPEHHGSMDLAEHHYYSTLPDKPAATDNSKVPTVDGRKVQGNDGYMDLQQ